LRDFLSDWHNLLPVAGLVVLAITAIILWLGRKRDDPSEIERRRRAYLNRIGRIVEGQVLEIVDRPCSPQVKKSPVLGGKHRAIGPANGTQKLLYYTYSISGVTYETAQDVTGLEERLHLNRIAAGQVASVKYDPSNPSNSILLADDWSGLH
jgi:hypothetical protein